MAINRSVYATVIVSGYVESIREQRKNSDGTVYAHDLTIHTESDGRLGVRIWLRDGAGRIELPSVGEFVAYISQVSERRDQNGQQRAELVVSRPVTPGDVDSLVSLVGGLAKA